ncbi:AfsR/SARP family transcriptional regulator [Longispora albida]|uniref:AfsR/SARP family transcriptional regulator n=1 Tax=Longispora albida TaxID=203523 RepID=UPI00038176EB|nr:AfsR/SARP family transcriptional regulator [Longispora albida]
MLNYLVLGSMEIRGPQDSIVRPAGTMRQTLLATFLAAGDKLVTIDALAEELWGTTPPSKMENALQAQVSRLRRTLAKLEPDRREPRLTTTASGYRLNVHWSELDAWSFLRTVEAIRNRAGTDLHRDIAELREALALWRGPIFGGLAGGPVCQTAAIKYAEARTTALELLYDLELKTGGHTRIIPELTELVAQNAMQEHFCSLLMVALYRSGRQIDALTVYRQLRYRLAEELGVEPSPVLRRYEKAILDHDPLLMRMEHQMAMR